MNILRFGNIFLAFSGVVIALCIVSIVWFGLEPGIEFTGGSLMEVAYSQARPSNEEIQEKIAALGIQVSSVQPVGDANVLLRMENLSEERHQQVREALGQETEEMRFESIGPVIGKELREKSFMLALVSLAAITLYIAFAFRKLPKPASSWKWSVVAMLALLHDVLVPLGLLALLGQYGGVQITIPVVGALLTIIGYSVNDTVVIFDRIRENLLKKAGDSFSSVVNKSLRQTFSRSFNTSVATLLSVMAIYFFGGETLSTFSLTLMVGIVAGAYSSLFLAPVVLVKWAERSGS